MSLSQGTERLIVESRPHDTRWGLCEYVIVYTILGGSPVILWISLGGKPKWLPLKFGYHDGMRTSPICIFLYWTQKMTSKTSFSPFVWDEILSSCDFHSLLSAQCNWKSEFLAVTFLCSLSSCVVGLTSFRSPLTSALYHSLRQAFPCFHFTNKLSRTCNCVWRSTLVVKLKVAQKKKLRVQSWCCYKEPERK